MQQHWPDPQGYESSHQYLQLPTFLQSEVAVQSPPALLHAVCTTVVTVEVVMVEVVMVEVVRVEEVEEVEVEVEVLNVIGMDWRMLPWNEPDV